jgi:hypothetical protein
MDEIQFEKIQKSKGKIDFLIITFVFISYDHLSPNYMHLFLFVNLCSCFMMINLTDI